MERKPWPIIILAALHFLGPAFNTLISAYMEKQSYGTYLKDFFAQGGFLDFFVMLALPILAGGAILAVKKWSYPVYLSLIVVASVYTLNQYNIFSSIFPLPIFLAMIVINTTVVGYFLIPSVKTIYFNKQLRWWETKPRYAIKIPAKLKNRSVKLHCRIVNISEGGVFISTKSAKLSTRATYDLTFSILDFEACIRAKLAHRRSKGLQGYGLRFIHDETTGKVMKQIIREISQTGKRLTRGRSNRSSKDNLSQWLKTAVTTGKGLVPEIPENLQPKGHEETKRKAA